LEDPLEKLLIPENLKKLGKILDSLSGVEKLMSRLSEMEKMGDLDTLMNLMSQLAALVDAAQKADLLGSLITFGVEQLSKVQAVWPLIQKLTDERTLTALQGVDVEGLIKGLNSLSPVLQKLSTEGAIRAMSSLDVEGLVNSLWAIQPLLSKISDERVRKAFESLNQDQVAEWLGTANDGISVLRKVTDWAVKLDKAGQLDTMLNLVDQLAALVDAAQKADLLGSLITFGVEQLSKVQAVWPLIQKLTDERTLTALQGVDVEGLIKGLNSLSPVLQKLSTEGAIRAMSSLDVEGLLSLLSKVAEMQRTGSLNAIFSLLSDQKMMDRFAVVIQRLSKALDIWANNLPNVKEVGLLGIPWALRDKDVQYGLGLVISLAGALGKSFRS
jgi:uncharacterized protein YjgD (DUF1641 family)